MARLDGHRPPGPEHCQVPQALLHGGGSEGRGGLDAASGLSSPDSSSLSDEETGSCILEMNINAGNWS